MNDGVKQTTFYIDGMHCDRCVDNVESVVSAAAGVKYHAVEIGRATIGFIPQITSRQEITKLLETAGYGVHLEPPHKSGWRRFVDQMIRSNEETFGGKTPDCCSIIGDQEKLQRQKRVAK